MTLSNITSKLTSMKSSTVRILAAATLAGATLIAAAPAAQAQRIVVGIGGPAYYAPAPPVVYGYGYPGYYGHGGWYGHGGYGRGYRR